MADEQEDALIDGEDQEQQQAQDDNEIVIEVEGEDEPQDEPDLVKHLRTVARDAQREAAELRKAQTSPAKVEIGKKPDLWDDCEGDPDKYDSALLDWHERKRQADAAENAQSRAQQTQAEQFERRKIEYRSKAATMGLQGMDDAEKVVSDALGADYVGLIIDNANKPAELIAALGKHPALLAKVVDEPNPVKRIMLLATMEAKVNVTRKKPPAPEAETIQRGSAPLSKPVEDKQAAKLLADAEKSGNMTEYNRYMKAKRKS